MALFKSKTEDKKKDESAGKPDVLAGAGKKEDQKPAKPALSKTGKDVKDEAKKETKAKRTGNAYKVLLRPMITEKASVLASENKYVFEVAKNTNRIEVAKAIKEVYGIKPASVNIINVRGKIVRRGRIEGKRKDTKKAIIKMPAGKSINVYEGV